MAIIRVNDKHTHKNQSELHERLSVMAETWGANRATAWGSRGGIEQRTPGWGIADVMLLLSLPERYQKEYRIPTYDRQILVFESKISRPDYSNLIIKLKCKSNPGNLNWVVAPKGLIETHELPNRWGLLEPFGSGLKEVYPAQYQPVGALHYYDCAETILWVGRYRKRREPVRCPDCLKRLAVGNEHELGRGGQE